MPIIKVQLLKGQPRAVKTRLMNALTDAFRMVIPASPAAITFVVDEIDRENYMRGGGMHRRVEAWPDPVARVQAYFAALREGDFDKADSFMTEEHEFHLPGGAVLRSNAEVVDWTIKRTTIEDFRITRIEALPGERGPVVYVHATLSGLRPDGSRYENRRLIGRHSFDGDKISRVDGWDDIGDRSLGADALMPDAGGDED